jgi:amidophosphoribosyltransferase
VRDVFKEEHMQNLLGNMGIGHVRYPTAGGSSDSLAQPFYVNSPYGISLAHNGNLTNTQELMDELFRTGLRHINTESDSEVLLNVLALELQNRGQLIPAAEDIFAAESTLSWRLCGDGNDCGLRHRGVP